jgi:hypothetical protein
MRKVSILIGICLLVAVALTVAAQQQENDLSPIMKDVGATMASLRKNLDAKSAADAQKDAEKLQMLFSQSEGFFKAMKAQDAVDMVTKDAAAAGEIAKAAKANNFDAAAEKAGAIQKTCKGCHDVHREQLPDKSYKFKQ